MRRKSKTKTIIILLLVLILVVVSLYFVLNYLSQTQTTGLPGFTWQTYPLETYKPVASAPSHGAGGVSP